MADKKLGHGPLRDRELPENFKQGKGMCFQRIVVLEEWRMDERQHDMEASLRTLSSCLLACEVLMSGIIFFLF